jgi:hypothetical protein
MTPDAGAQPGEPSPADSSGPRELLAYRSAQGRWVVAAMILGSSVAGIDSTVVAVALPAIGRNLHAGFRGPCNGPSRAKTMPKNRLEAFSDGVIAILITIMPWRFP